jgi:hypothetical protein
MANAAQAQNREALTVPRGAGNISFGQPLGRPETLKFCGTHV